MLINDILAFCTDIINLMATSELFNSATWLCIFTFLFVALMYLVKRLKV